MLDSLLQEISSDPDAHYPQVLVLVLSLCPPLALLVQQVRYLRVLCAHASLHSRLCSPSAALGSCCGVPLCSVQLAGSRLLADLSRLAVANPSAHRLPKSASAITVKLHMHPGPRAALDVRQGRVQSTGGRPSLATDRHAAPTGDPNGNKHRSSMTGPACGSELDGAPRCCVGARKPGLTSG